MNVLSPQVEEELDKLAAVVNETKKEMQSMKHDMDTSMQSLAAGHAAEIHEMTRRHSEQVKVSKHLRFAYTYAILCHKHPVG